MGQKAKLFSVKRDYISRHLRNGLRHMTAAKALNLVKNSRELRRKTVDLASMPYFIKVETTPYCHLRCPGCPHGSDPQINRDYSKNCLLSLDDFKRVVDPIKDALLAVSLGGRGEPLINPATPAMVRYCHENNIGTSFPTNFSLRLDDQKLEEIVASGLDHIMLSIDGVTQEVYGRYRVGGNLKLVLANAERLIEMKRRLKSKTPAVEFKFILFEHNEHETVAAEKLASDMGFDKFSLVLANESKDQLGQFVQIAAVNQAKKKACFWPWQTMAVFWDGSVSACCLRELYMGNILTDGFPALWNGENYRALRSFFSANGETPRETGRWLCENCMVF